MVPAEKRFLLLFTFLKKNANKKVLHCCPACRCQQTHCNCTSSSWRQSVNAHFPLL
jgi:hypothetical protein